MYFFCTQLNPKKHISVAVLHAGVHPPACDGGGVAPVHAKLQLLVVKQFPMGQVVDGWHTVPIHE